MHGVITEVHVIDWLLFLWCFMLHLQLLYAELNVRITVNDELQGTWKESFLA